MAHFLDLNAFFFHVIVKYSGNDVKNPFEVCELFVELSPQRNKGFVWLLSSIPTASDSA